MSWALLLESYFRHIYHISWFHRIRKNGYFSITSKAESWEQVQAPEQLPLTNAVMYTRLHIALHVCCTQQWNSLKQILFPVPWCWWCRMVQHCSGGRTGCLYTTLAVHFTYQQMTLVLPCWVSVPHHFYVLRLWESSTSPMLLPVKWSVIKAASK